MAARLRRNAIVVSALALFFAWGFESAKHDPVLRSIIPFGDDPYDAIGSFAFIASVLLTMVSLVRAFLPAFVGQSGAAIYVLRSQAAVAFCVLVAVAADVVAMGRHASMWIGSPGQNRLLILLAALVASACAVLVLVRNSRTPGPPGLYAKAIWVWLGSLLVLCIYPEKIIVGTVGHLLTVVLGDVLLFAPVATLVRAFLPSTVDRTNRSGNTPRAHGRYLPVTLAAATGLLIGAFVFLAEMRESDFAAPSARLLFVAAVYLGLGLVGLLIGYLALGRLLGFVIDGPISPNPSSNTICQVPNISS